ncbi:MAG: dihydroorotate dehydrogenase electron transfer subunit [Prolixibacteraceae bacterium]|jgi:dihydroorotate dehydrogenase electron transfer subunit|nr:dihydroorotate dehydrogenase electron transfer subunit [Prolixibacteraceae bacterium]
MKKEVSNLLVTKNIALNHDNFLIELKADSPVEQILPGQFVNVKVEKSPNTFLRRPFSVHDTYPSTNSFSILVKAVGDGTEALSVIKEGQRLDVVFPLGNGFKLPSKGESILLIGGGVGIAPIMHLARISKEKGADVHILLGARTLNDHILIDEFKRYGTVHLTTDDGSLGTKGFVTNHPVIDGKIRFNRYQCCGPDPMMQAVARKAKQNETECEVSLENMMACGFGVCLCCVTKTNEGNKCVCTEGPVFNINNLEWQI